jgi:ABC-2 type transport system permease protein
MNEILAVCRNELRRIFSIAPVFSVLLVAVVLYAAFYPQPYLNEALRKVPIAVVDQDGTPSSRELTRLVDATPDASVAMVLPDVATAQREVYTRAIFGILLIPQHFERDLLHGRPSPIALYADASYFLVYQRVSAAVTAVAHTLGTQVETSRLIAIGVDPVIAAAVPDPMPLTAVPIFNPQGGYATYILPAAFVLLLQQTLLIGVCLLGTLRSSGAPEVPAGPVSTVFGKLLAYLAVEAIVVPFYLIAVPYLYGLPRLGSVAHILALAVPFVLAVSTLGMVLSSLFRSPLAVQLASAALGLPFLFLAGFSWPVEAIPPAIRLCAMLVPSTFAIEGLVNVGQLGATLFDVRREFLGLWTLVAFYGCIAVLLEARRRGPAPSTGNATA